MCIGFWELTWESEAFKTLWEELIVPVPLCPALFRDQQYSEDVSTLSEEQAFLPYKSTRSVSKSRL